jgi:hypothetical protein
MKLAYDALDDIADLLGPQLLDVHHGPTLPSRHVPELPGDFTRDTF